MTATGRRRGLVLAWMPTCQRCRTLGARLDYDVVLLGRSGFRRPWTAPLTYPRLVALTVRELVRRRPRSIVVVAPPFVAPLLVLPIARMLGARTAVDVHSGALLDDRWRWSVPVLRLVAARASATIVTLPSLVPELGRAAASAIVLPDPLPDLARGEDGEAGPEAGAWAAGEPTAHQVPTEGELSGKDGLPSVVAVAGWGDDEPLQELASAASGRPWRLAITGRQRRPVEAPENVRLTGFLDDAAYVGLLREAAVVVALTTRAETLLSGAWEAIALRKALVLSDTAALRTTFGDAAVYSSPSTEGIRSAVGEALARRDALERAAADLATALDAASEQTIEQLRSRLEARR